ncbi:MAG: phenylalanine--tRNA ligase subunit beta [Phycisphaerales bacterium]|nr:phenylalanine--tRNA ligase subunit beta [Phycisphaerales bacterium]
MKSSVKWLNDYLDPPADPEQQADALTACGFPFEGRESLPDGDVQQEIEMASNRGDCVCHAGMAREIAAITGRSFKAPSGKAIATGPPSSKLIRVENTEPELCPLYTAQVITGVKVGPSPDWLQERLKAIGQVPRNNLVDATNFVLFEMGQPTHVFDLDLIEGGRIIIRRAHEKEPFTPIGEDAVKIELSADDLVIADGSRAVAIAGVKGGDDTAVSETTTNILVEAATFDRVAVRNSSRRLAVASDSSYRFERGVHPAEVGTAADRLVALILEIAGGTLHEGVVADGAPLPQPKQVTMRPERCCTILGHDLDPKDMIERLETLEFSPVLEGDLIRCTIPPRRLDVAEEIDVIEEVGRTWGYERLPINDSISVRPTAPQGEQLALNLIRTLLVGEGFIETISHSLVSDRDAGLFLPEGRETLRVEENRAGGEPSLRPSVLPSLLHIARRNRDRAGISIRGFEIASIFDRTGEEHRERRSLGMVIDGRPDSDPSEQYRTLKGVVEQIGTALRGSTEAVSFRAPEPGDEGAWLAPRATIMLDGQAIGQIGLVEGGIAGTFDADGPIAAAELIIADLIEGYPPAKEASALPHFPSIDRDLSIVVAEDVPWTRLEEVAHGAGDELLDGIEFVTTWRDKKLGADRKSVTMRLRFRAGDRTLTHAEVDPQVKAISDALTTNVDGELRT